MLQAGRSPVRPPNEVDFFNLPNPSSRTMALVLRPASLMGMIFILRWGNVMSILLEINYTFLKK
jgi:hypothetical protein